MNVPKYVGKTTETEYLGDVSNKVIKVIANKNTSYAICQNGDLWAWGEGYTNGPERIDFTNNSGEKIDVIDMSASGILDIYGNVYKKSDLTRLTISEKIVSMSEGKDHVVFLSENGTAYAIRRKRIWSIWRRNKCRKYR